MTTVAKLVARSLRALKVIDPKQPVKDVDMQTCIESLNAMMARWEANGRAVGWSPVANPSDEVPIPPEAEDAVVYNLAVRVAPDYVDNAPPNVLGLAQETLRELIRDVAVANPQSFDRVGTYYDIRIDGYR